MRVFAVLVAVIVVAILLFVWNASSQGSKAGSASSTPGSSPSTSSQTVVAMAQLNLTLKAAQDSATALKNAVYRFTDPDVIKCMDRKKSADYTFRYYVKVAGIKRKRTGNGGVSMNYDAKLPGAMNLVRTQLSKVLKNIDAVASTVAKIDPNNPASVTSLPDPTVGIEQTMQAQLSDMLATISDMSSKFSSWIENYKAVIDSSSADSNQKSAILKAAKGCIPGDGGISTLAQTLQSRVSSLAGTYQSLASAAMGLS